jgi:hypothetical protein
MDELERVTKHLVNSAKDKAKGLKNDEASER